MVSVLIVVVIAVGVGAWYVVGWWQSGEDDPASQLIRAVNEWQAGPPTGAALDDFRRQWPPEQIHPLLQHGWDVVRSSAVFALAMVGDRESIDPLLERLVDRSVSVRRGADAAIWRIWFRLGSERANRLVAVASQQMRSGAVDEAFESLERAIADSPDFAEAYNQRAIIHFNLRAFADSVEDCRLTLERMPVHYGTLVGMGQCLLQLGRDTEAIEAFRKAQQINPGLNLEGLIKALECRLEAGELRV